VLSISIEGLLEQNSVPPHVKTIYPLSKAKNEEAKLIPEAITNFINSGKKIIFIGFGSTFKPSQEFVTIMVQFAKSN